MLQAMRTLRLLAVLAGCILAAVGCQDAGTAPPAVTPSPTGSRCPAGHVEDRVAGPAQDIADSAVWQYLFDAGPSRDVAALRLLRDDALWRACITLPTQSLRASLAEAGDAKQQLQALDQEGAAVHETMLACLTDTPPAELPTLDKSRLCQRYNNRLLPAVLGSQMMLGYLQLLAETRREGAGEIYQLMRTEWPICYQRLAQGIFSARTVGDRVYWDAMATVDCRSEAYGEIATEREGWQPQGPFPGIAH